MVPAWKAHGTLRCLRICPFIQVPDLFGPTTSRHAEVGVFPVNDHTGGDKEDRMQ